MWFLLLGVGWGGVGEGELLEWLRGRLPEYLVPWRVVVGGVPYVDLLVRISSTVGSL